jgi:hypothetical protein
MEGEYEKERTSKEGGEVLPKSHVPSLVVRLPAITSFCCSFLLPVLLPACLCRPLLSSISPNPTIRFPSSLSLLFLSAAIATAATPRHAARH